MKKFFLKLLGKTEPIEMAGAEVEMEGKKVPLELLVNSYKAVKAEEEKVALENSVKNLSDDAIVTVDGKEVTVKDLKAAHTAMLLKNAAPATTEALATDTPAAATDKTEKAPDTPKTVAEVKTEDKPTEAEVLANAKAAKDKADEEAKIAAEKAEKDKNFQALKNAKDKGGVPVKLPAYESQADRLARGKKMFGEETTAPKP